MIDEGKLYWYYHPDDDTSPLKVEIVSPSGTNYYVVVDQVSAPEWDSVRFVTAPENLYELDSPELQLLLSLRRID